MNKYKVKVPHIFAEIIDVEAANEEEAIKKASEILNDKSYQGDPYYEITMPPSQWPVISEEDLQKLLEREAGEEQEKESSNIITP